MILCSQDEAAEWLAASALQLSLVDVEPEECARLLVGGGTLAGLAPHERAAVAAHRRTLAWAESQGYRSPEARERGQVWRRRSSRAPPQSLALLPGARAVRDDRVGHHLTGQQTTTFELGHAVSSSTRLPPRPAPLTAGRDLLPCLSRVEGGS